MTTYKITAADGSPVHGGKGAWSRPRGKRPGAWRSVTDKLVPCVRGLHVCAVEHLPHWLATDAVVWEVETRGESIEQSDKLVVREARLTRKVGTLDHRTLVAWACDCAKHVLPIFEAEYPDDDRPRRAIETTRAWLRGEATIDQVRAADAAADAAVAARQGERRWQGEHLIELLEAQP